MTNRYLEKLALNRFEKHLADQPVGKTYSDPRIHRAKGIVDRNALVHSMAHDFRQLGAIQQAEHYEANSRTAMHGLRGNDRTLQKVHRDSSRAFPFANTGDELLLNKAKTTKGTRMAGNAALTKEQRFRNVKRQRFERIKALNEAFSAKAKAQSSQGASTKPGVKAATNKAYKEQAKSTMESPSFRQKLKGLVEKAFKGVKSRPGLTAGVALGGAGLGYGAYKLSKKD